MTESHLVNQRVGNFHNSIIESFNSSKSHERQVRSPKEPEGNGPGFRHSCGVTHDDPCIVKVNNIKSPKVDEHILFIDEIENGTCNRSNLTPDIGIGLQMTHTCANSDLVERRKHDRNELEICHIERNGDKLLKIPRLEDFEDLRRGINKNKAQEPGVSKICDFESQPHENTESSNHEAGCEGRRRVVEIGERCQ
ncbi:hypothetical protein QAD02_021282 [Eretmocerus hayati]|uniref:Uncharacterized protein n=1 Tax=Eretmocerus hayati TaxID=131215 RepID=A0ACC2PSC8_9HYME|nr:hypothetical protein QAD02_021282 [Eretmocerus hayati]